MAKYEIEIDDATACWLCGMPNLPSSPEVIDAAEYCVRQYAGKPEVVGPRHLAALAIVRANVTEQTRIVGTYQQHSTEADRLLDFVLEGR